MRFFEGLSRALFASIGEGGTLLLDDLHWFDAASLELTGHLARRALDTKVRLIATARHHELEQNQAATPILNDLKRDGLYNPISLEALQESDVCGLMQALSGSDASLFAHRRSGVGTRPGIPRLRS